MSESRQSNRIPPRIIEMSDERWADYLTGFRAGYETAEAAFRKPRFRFEDRDRLFDEIDKRFGRTVARFVDDRLARLTDSAERPEADR